MQPVLPGDRLGVVEEFLPGLGTYEDGGTIYANFTGTARIDNKNKVTGMFVLRTPLYSYRVGLLGSLEDHRALEATRC